MAEHTVHDEMLAMQLCVQNSRGTISGTWLQLSADQRQHWRLKAYLMVSEGQQQRRTSFYNMKKEQANG